jgi:hypothetical protein
MIPKVYEEKNKKECGGKGKIYNLIGAKLK